jgi:hypothetical protein
MQVAEKHHTAWNQARGWLMATAWPALLLIICIGFFWKLVLTNQYTWLDHPDMANQVLPWYQFQAGEWHAGRIPLWDPYLWGGQPLLGQGQPGAAYPLNWLLFLAPLRNGWMRQSYLHWYFVLIHFQAALFCYLLCRDLKRSQPASLLSGIAFGLGGFMGTNAWPQMLNGAVWAPLVLLFFLRAMRGRRPVASAAWSGAFLGISFLSGHHQIPIFICLAMGGAWLYYLLPNSGLRLLRLKLLLVFCLFLILVSALQTIPAYEYGQLARRWVGAQNPIGWEDKVPYFIHQRYSFFPTSILGIVVPGIFRNSDPFIGLVALTLALFGVIASWQDRVTRLFAGIALGGLLFSLGQHSVFHGILYSLVPILEKARNPSMAIFIFHFGLCVLIAYGIDNYRFLTSALIKRVAVLLSSFAALTALAVWVMQATKTVTEDRLGIVVLAGFLFAAILIAWANDRIPERAAISSLALLMLLELGNVTTYNYQARGEAKSLVTNLSEHADIAAFLGHQIGPVRVEVNENDIPYNFGDWYGIDHFGGYLASITENVTRVQESVRARNMYGTNFHVGRTPTRPDQLEVFTGRSGLKVYENPGAFPRAWIVHEVAGIERDDQIRPTLDAANFDPSRQTFVKGTAPQLESCPATETASLMERQPGRMVLEADLKCRGMLIEADTFFPGWVAIIDGKPSRLYEAYGFLRGVVVEAGTHRIEIQYQPKSVYWGASLTALGLFGAFVLTTIGKRQRP